MKKANILIESLISLSFVVISSVLISQLFIQSINQEEIEDPFDDLSKDCKIQCVIEKLIP